MVVVPTLRREDAFAYPFSGLPSFLEGDMSLKLSGDSTDNSLLSTQRSAGGVGEVGQQRGGQRPKEEYVTLSDEVLNRLALGGEPWGTPPGKSLEEFRAKRRSKKVTMTLTLGGSVSVCATGGPRGRWVSEGEEERKVIRLKCPPGRTIQLVLMGDWREGQEENGSTSCGELITKEEYDDGKVLMVSETVVGDRETRPPKQWSVLPVELLEESVVY